MERSTSLLKFWGRFLSVDDASSRIDGISSRLLTERLRDLEEKGFIFRDYKPTIPPAVTYGLTKRMQEIGVALDKLDELAQKWQQEDSKRIRRNAKGM